MFSRIISFSVRQPLVIAIGVIGLIAWGMLSFRELPIDAVPDITNNQVQIVTLSPALAAQEVERLLTIPVEQTMATIDGIVERRSMSRFGLSVVTLVFDEDVDTYWARAQVDQRLAEAQEQIAGGLGTPVMMPITTGLGEIYQYALRVDEEHAGEYDAMELRTIHDWMVRRRLLGTKGVADVASFGGYLRQLEIAVNPERLQAHGLSMADILDAVQRNNANSGGAYIEKGPDVAYIRTEGMVRSIADVEKIPVATTENGLPILIRHVADVRNGHAVRYGALTLGDSTEGVGGIVYMLKGENSSRVIETVKERMAEIEKTLPEGITIAPYLDRSALVDRTIATVATNLVEGALIVIFVLVILMGNMRAGLIAASVIPLSMLFAIGMMTVFGVSGNLMSLGAIDFGLIVDGSIIVLENILFRMVPGSRVQVPGSQLQGHGTWNMEHGTIEQRSIERSSIEIRKSAMVGEGIILIVYLPLLTLVGVEGKMFLPMAQTVMFAIAGAFILSMTYVPMMAAVFLRKPHDRTERLSAWVMERMRALYTPARAYALRKPALVLSVGGGLLAGAVVAFMMAGSEFIPTLNEGDFAIETRLPPGTSLSETVEITQKAARILKAQFPEVKEVVGKVGTTEIPLDPMPLEASDVMVILKPRKEWTSASTREELVAKMEEALSVLPGVEFGFQQPIQMRFNELMTGARQDVVVKIFGEDLHELQRLADNVGTIVRNVDGAHDVFVEPIEGLPQIVVGIDRDACSLYGVSVDAINTTIRAAFAGEPAGVLYEGERRFDIVVRLHPSNKRDIADFERLTVPTLAGGVIPLIQVARVKVEDGPNQVQREEGRRRVYVGFNVRDRDVSSIVDEVRTKLDATLRLPAGYEVTYGGQFENLEEASARLALAVPAALLLIVVLLYLSFNSVRDTVLIFTAVPFSAVGGVAALLLRDMPFSISAGVGFIALFGVSVLNGIVLLAAFRDVRRRGVRNAVRVVVEGTSRRLRPVAMTALVASLGFLPMALSTSDGAEVQRPLATVVIGGLVTSTLLTMILLPVLYVLWERIRPRPLPPPQHTSPTSSLPVVVIAFLMLIAAPSLHAQVPRTMTLDEIRALVRTRNIDIQSGRSSVQQVKALKGAAVEWGRTSVEWMGGQYNAYEFDNAFTVKQSIPWLGTISKGHDLHSERLRRSELQADITVRDVMASTERAFDRIAYAREILRLADTLRGVLSRTARAADLRTRLGESATLERVSAQSQLSELIAKLSEYEADLRRAESTLQILCNDVLITTSDTILRQRPLPEDTSTATVLVDAARAAVSTAKAEADLAASYAWPNFNVGYSNQSLTGAVMPDGSIATGDNRFHVAFVAVDVPLIFGPVSARSEQAELNVDLAERERNAALHTIDLRRRQLMLEISAYAATLEHYNGPAQEEVRILVDHGTRAYEAGEISWLELRQALEQAVRLRINRLDALLRYNDAVISLELLTKD